jgi:hypothetical protein
MVQESLSLSEFRLKIGALCRLVRQGKTELTVKRYYDDFFKVVKADTEGGIDLGLTYARDNVGDFVQAIEDHGSVTLSSHGRILAKCVMLEAIAASEVKGCS